MYLLTFYFIRSMLLRPEEHLITVNVIDEPFADALLTNWTPLVTTKYQLMMRIEKTLQSD